MWGLVRDLNPGPLAVGVAGVSVDGDQLHDLPDLGSASTAARTDTIKWTVTTPGMLTLYNKD